MNQPSQNAAGVILNAASMADITTRLPGPTGQSVQNILNSVRAHLNMDVAFVSEFVGEQRHFRNVDAKGRSPIKPGDVMPLADGYCQRVVLGLLPELIVDTGHVPLAMALPDTKAVPIGSHLSVPIRLRDGHVYGTFCCFNFETDPTLNERDLSVMRAFAEVAAHQIDFELELSAARSAKISRIASALDRHQPTIVYQPVVELERMKVVGLECLSRFDFNPYQGPDLWFAEAGGAGLGAKLELQAIRNGLDGLKQRGLTDDICVWLNVSAATLSACDLTDHLQGAPLDRLVLELTEHDHVEDYASLHRALRPLRAQGVSVAIDDAGAGYASMSHILNIEPDHIKLDLSLTRNIDVDRKRRALAAALIEFGRQTGAKIVAEGVESIAELNELRRLGVNMAQGFYIGEPVQGDALVNVLAEMDARSDVDTTN